MLKSPNNTNKTILVSFDYVTCNLSYVHLKTFASSISLYLNVSYVINNTLNTHATMCLYNYACN